VVSQLNVSQFTLDLDEHPDWQAVNYVLEGLMHGFRLGIQPARRLRAAKRNKPSAFHNRDHPIRLHSEFQLDVQWWNEFLAS